jgi:hypothetical protein
MTTLPPEELLVHTLDLLEYRLHRLEYLLNGNDSSTNLPKGTTVTARLSKLKDALGQLAARSRTVEQLLRLRMTNVSRTLHKISQLTHDPEAQHPDLFASAVTEDTGLSHDQKFSLVLTEAPAYLTLASQLRSLQDVHLPPTSSFTHLVAQQSRFAAIQATQDAQAREIAELRKRSAVLVSRWYEVQVLGVGRCWAEWERRFREVERGVRRVEVGQES